MSKFAGDCLSGKSVLITGALGAIGRVVVGELLAHGARVTANDILAQDEAQKIAGESGWDTARYTYARADITRSNEIQSLIQAARDHGGRLDIALCHAGMVHNCPIADYPEQEWDRILALNLRGAFLVAQASARSMAEQKIAGKIIFTSSWVQDVPWPEITPYTVSKSGLRTLMRGMARELAPQGIRVNAIAPGIVGAGMAKRQWDADPAYRRRAEKAIPLGFLQPAESVADGFLFLCSGASDYMTGATLLIDGGCSLYPMD
jgi:NAD(P)-dependent dehydrogenase (short-subunit alcohol dehydrogenase family)